MKQEAIHCPSPVARELELPRATPERIARQRVERARPPRWSVVKEPIVFDRQAGRGLELLAVVRPSHRVTKLGLLANIAYRTGRRIYWDDEHERIRDDREASKLLSRKFRKPYTF